MDVRNNWQRLLLSTALAAMISGSFAESVGVDYAGTEVDAPAPRAWPEQSPDQIRQSVRNPNLSEEKNEERARAWAKELEFIRAGRKFSATLQIKVSSDELAVQVARQAQIEGARLSTSQEYLSDEHTGFFVAIDRNGVRTWEGTVEKAQWNQNDVGKKPANHWLPHTVGTASPPRSSDFGRYPISPRR